MNFLNKKLNIYIISVLFFVGILFLFFNDFGVLKYMKLQNDVNELNVQIKEVQEENARLQKEIDSLKQNIPAKVEEIAREKYNMIREGEKAIKVKEE